MFKLTGIISELTTPSSYERDWYGWSKNQISHVLLGVCSIVVPCLLCFLFYGEYPDLYTSASASCATFASFQFFVQKDREFDVLADIFFWGCGVFSIAFGVEEVAAGMSAVHVSPVAILVIFCLSVAGLVAGILSRIKRAPRHES